MDELGYKWKGVVIWYRPAVKFAIVLDWSQLPIFLLSEKESAGIG